MERTADAIAAMVDEAQRAGVAAIAAVGTAGLRIARNALRSSTWCASAAASRIEVIPGDEEATRSPTSR